MITSFRSRQSLEKYLKLKCFIQLIERIRMLNVPINNWFFDRIIYWYRHQSLLIFAFSARKRPWDTCFLLLKLRWWCFSRFESFYYFFSQSWLIWYFNDIKDIFVLAESVNVKRYNYKIRIRTHQKMLTDFICWRRCLIYFLWDYFVYIRVLK